MAPRQDFKITIRLIKHALDGLIQIGTEIVTGNNYGDRRPIAKIFAVLSAHSSSKGTRCSALLTRCVGVLIGSNKTD